MEHTLAGIRNRIQIDKLDDEEFDSSVIDNFINDTQRDIFLSAELPFMEKIFSGTINPGATIFKFPTDLSMIQSQVIVSPTGVAKDIEKGYIDFKDFNMSFPIPSNNAPSEICNWTLYGGKMLLSAPTDVEYTMSTFYIKTPTLLTQDSDIPEVPEEFNELLVLGAYKRVLERNEDFDLSAVVGGEYERLFGMMVSRYGFRKSGPIIMKRK